MNVLQIMEGWRNHLVPPKELETIIDSAKKERMSICDGCSFNSKNRNNIGPETCTACGCILSAKTACLSCKCPKDKWNEIDVKPKEDEES